MKLTPPTLTLLSAALLVPVAPATDTVLYGNSSFSLNYPVSRNSYDYLGMSGRKSYLYAPYIRTGYLYSDYIANFDNRSTSGSLSYEFHRKDYYGGGSGQVLYTIGYSPLDPGEYYAPINLYAYLKSPGRYGWGTFILKEFDYDSDADYYRFFTNDTVSVAYDYF